MRLCCASGCARVYVCVSLPARWCAAGVVGGCARARVVVDVGRAALRHRGGGSSSWGYTRRRGPCAACGRTRAWRCRSRWACSRVAGGCRNAPVRHVAATPVIPCRNRGMRGRVGAGKASSIHRGENSPIHPGEYTSHLFLNELAQRGVTKFGV